MKQLSADAVMKAKRFIDANGTALALAKFDYRLNNGRNEPLLDALSSYQNRDGGFGHGLEPDFLLPESSAMATSIAFQTFRELDLDPQHTMVQQGIDYLLATYDEASQKWAAVPAAVNDYPHAPWWHFDETKAGTALDANWGNPTAELIGYLKRFSGQKPDPLVDRLYNYALDYLLSYQGEMEIHELYCFQRFANHVESDDREKVDQKLAEQISNAVNTDRDSWHGYSAQPLDFIKSPYSTHAANYEEALEANLDFWMETLSPEGIWLPSWSWGQYEASWQEARNIIAGMLTVDRLTVLKRFGRLERDA